jgi:hypothetical protein
MIVVTLEAKPSEIRDLIHQFQNFGEDVYRWVRDNHAGEVDFREIDGPTGKFAIRNVKVQMSRRVMQWVELEATKQHLTISLDLQQQIA